MGSLETPKRKHVKLAIKSHISKNKYKISLLVVKKIMDKLLTQYVDTDTMEHLSGLSLADEDWNIRSNIDMLIGAQLFPHIVLGNKVLSRHTTNASPAIQTVFRYILYG